jgi:hypothetical protein
MITPDRKVRKLMEEYGKTGNLTTASLRADMDRKTARRYVETGKMPSEVAGETAGREWRTREDGFADDWGEVEERLEAAPELEAKALFDWLCEEHPGVYQEGQLRTFQRRVREWRALNGPEQEVYFPQEHEPGMRMETDFTSMNSLQITINRERFPHLVCHSVLVYSNWEWGTICESESFLALRHGLQRTLVRLGRIPVEHWTDHTTAATHEIRGQGGRERGFNRQYLELMGHYKMQPHTIQVREPHENGDVESAHGVLKRRMEQHLLLRGHRDFASEEAYEAFLTEVFDKANRGRTKRLAEELAVMRVLDVRLLPEYREEEARVTSWSTVQVSKKTYSVPSRLKGQKVKARVYEDRVEIYFKGSEQLTTPRLRGEKQHAVNYRHVIGSLVRKPGAFRRYRYREDMFPSETFRWAYDALCEGCSNRTADKEYLRILNHAAKTMECRVERALTALRHEGKIPRWETVLALSPGPCPEVPALTPLSVDLTGYDHLLGREEVSS